MVVGWWAFLRPVPLGGPTTLVWVHGVSMEPTLHGGDLVITRARDDYSVGDIVAFRAGNDGEGAIVIHRIVGTDGDRFVIQGDNRDGGDPWTPTAEEIVGSQWVLVPRAGDVIGFFGRPLVWAACAGLAAVLLLGSWALKPDDTDGDDNQGDDDLGDDNEGHSTNSGDITASAPSGAADGTTIPSTATPSTARSPTTAPKTQQTTRVGRSQKERSRRT